MTIKIFLVDDQCLMQEGIKAILKDESEINIVGTAKDGQEAIALVQKLQPDIVLLDIEMPKINGIAVTKYIDRFLPNTQVIILSGHGSQAYVRRALEAGAVSYVLKDSLAEDLKQAIYSLQRGYAYMEAKLLNRALNKFRNRDRAEEDVVHSSKKTTYIQRYRKHIYIPSSLRNCQYPQNESLVDKQTSSKKTHPGINKSSLAPILEASSPDEIQTASELSANLKTLSSLAAPKKKNQKQLRQRIIWLILAIASFILTIAIFQ